MLILKPTLSKGSGSGCYQIRQSQDETGVQRQRERERELGKRLLGFSVHLTTACGALGPN